MRTSVVCGLFAGGLYNSDDEGTYVGTVRQKGRLLELKGCAFNVVCRNQTRRRPHDVLAEAQAR